MKALLTLLFCLSTLSGFSQDYCKSILKKAEAAFEDNQLDEALSILQDAETCDYKNTLQKARQNLQTDIFKAIQQQGILAIKSQDQAILAQNQALAARDSAITAENEAISARNDAIEAKKQSDRLASYFFQPGSTESAAWAYGPNGKFGVINRDGQLQGEGFVWEKPASFQQGYAIAKRGGDYWIIDQMGTAASEGYDLIHPTDLSFLFGYNKSPSYWSIEKEQYALDALNGIDWRRITLRRTGFQSIKESVSFFRFDRGGKWGFINAEGKEVIKPKYYQVDDFSDGLAWVNIGASPNKNGSFRGGKWGLVNAEGKEIISPKYDDVNSFYKGLARVQIGGYRDEMGHITGGKWGFINAEGKKVITPKYDAVEDFSDGLAWVNIGASPNMNGITYSGHRVRNKLRGGKWGLINVEGKEVIRPKYDAVEDFSDGLAWVNIGTPSGHDRGTILFRGGKWGLVNAEGKEVITPKYDDFKDFSDGLAWVNIDASPNMNGFSCGGKWGLVNAEGKEVVKPKYDDFKDFSDGLAWVNIGAALPDRRTRFSMGGKWGLINEEGKEVIRPKYDAVEDFSDGLAWVNIGAAAAPYVYSRILRGGKVGLINAEGKEVIKPQYDNFKDFSEGLARVKKDEKWGLINAEGKEVIKPQYDDFKDFSEGLARVKKDEKWGLINAEGKEVIKPQYDDFKDFSEGLARVKKDGKWSLINQTGEDVNALISMDIVFGSFEKLTWVRTGGIKDRDGDHYGGKLGLYNASGEEIMPMVYDEYHMIRDKMNIEGRIYRIYIVEQGSRLGLLAVSGYETGAYDSTKFVPIVRLLPCDYEEIGRTYTKSYLRVQQNGKWGFVFWEPQPDGTDKPVLRIRCRYDLATDFFEREGEMVARVYMAEHDLEFYINMKGEMLVEIVAE